MEPDTHGSDSDGSRPRRAKRQRVCSEPQSAPRGPASFDETFEWASFLLRSLLDFCRKRDIDLPARLSSNLDGRQIVISTTYSGMGCPEQSLRFVQAALQQHVGVRPVFVCYSAMDADPLCRRVLQQLGDGGPTHVFGDIYELIPDSLKNELMLLQKRARAKCARRVANHPDQHRDLSEQLGDEFLKEACACMRKHRFHKKQKLHCSVHGHECPIIDVTAADDALHVEVGGHTCTPWSSAGKRGGYLDAEALPAIVWLFFVRFKKPHIFIDERTPLFDGKVVEQALGCDYHISAMTFTPVSLGIPTNRTRRYTHAILKSMGDVVFPVNHETLQKVAFRSCDLDPGVYFRAPPSMVHEYTDRVAAVRGLPPRLGLSRPYKFLAVMSPGCRYRAEKYILKAMKAGLLKDIAQRDIVVNTMQNCEYFTALGRTFPALMRKSKLFSLRLRRGMLPLEQMLVQGVPLFTERHDGLGSLSLDFLQTLTDAQVRHLAGNGMALSAIGTVLVLSLCALPASR